MPDPGEKPITGTIDVPGLGRKSMYDQDDLLQSVFVAEEGLVEPESVWITRERKMVLNTPAYHMFMSL